MKYLIALLLLSGCGVFTTGEGVFEGRLVDVSWEGLLFKSCEVDFQFGENSSKISRGSTKDKALCDKLQSEVGTTVKVNYKTWVMPCCLTMDSNYEIYK